MILRSTLWFAIFLLSLAIGACSTSGSSVRSGTATAVTTSKTAMPPPDTTSSGGVYTGISDYRVGPQDLLDVSVFQVPELTTSLRVNSFGQISLPLVGTLQAGGLTVQELEAEIAKKLAEKYLQNPQVTVFIKEYSSQRVTLEGAVNRPGMYPLTGRTTLLQCIAMGGDFTQMADLKGVVVFRQVNGKKMAAVFDIKAIRAGNAEDPLVYGDDVIVVDTSGSKTAMRTLIQTIPVLNVFGLIP
jgi:polysaccharide export outer membrane protein